MDDTTSLSCVTVAEDIQGFARTKFALVATQGDVVDVAFTNKLSPTDSQCHLQYFLLYCMHLLPYYCNTTDCGHIKY